MDAVRIAVCDDEQGQVDYLCGLVKKWAAGIRLPISVKTFASAEAFLFDSEPFDIILLDIQMGRMNGMELAKRIREDDVRAQIIFITAYPDFIADGYDVDAVHYLMKPVGEDKLPQILDKAAARLSGSAQGALFNVDGDTVRIMFDDILYIESFAHIQEINTVQGVYKVKIPFFALEKQLGGGFIRTHRSYIAGVAHMQKVTKNDVALTGGKLIPLARRQYDAVNKAFIRFYPGATNER